ncbi:MAG: hypothetical protein ACO3FE_00775, partial [Planctomycetaceae bacterium]
ADGPASTEVLHELRKELTQWPQDTGDALLDPENPERLTRGVQAVQEKVRQSDIRKRIRNTCSHQDADLMLPDLP